MLTVGWASTGALSDASVASAPNPAVIPVVFRNSTVFTFVCRTRASWRIGLIAPAFVSSSVVSSSTGTAYPPAVVVSDAAGAAPDRRAVLEVLLELAVVLLPDVSDEPERDLRVEIGELLGVVLRVLTRRSPGCADLYRFSIRYFAPSRYAWSSSSMLRARTR
jgi:hypothetical protein